MNTFKIVQYNKEYDDTWDRFVLSESINGTVFHSRKFLSYHEEDKFNDRSILIYDKNKLISVFPACKVDDTIISHSGSSCGGPVIHKKYFRSGYIPEIIEMINDYYSGKSLVIKISENVYYDGNTNDLLLFEYEKRGFDIKREIGSAKEINKQNIIDSITKQTSRSVIRKLSKTNLRIVINSDSADIKSYYDILVKNLNKHNTKPTHNLKEILKLVELLGERQRFVFVKDETGNILSGIWLIEGSSKTLHTQYIAKDYDFNINGVVDLGLFGCFEYAYAKNFKYVNLGVSTENEGSFLNRQLLGFKEGLGTFFTSRYIVSG